VPSVGVGVGQAGKSVGSGSGVFVGTGVGVAVGAGVGVGVGVETGTLGATDGNGAGFDSELRNGTAMYRASVVPNTPSMPISPGLLTSV
jgi:hypothetical protein